MPQVEVPISIQSTPHNAVDEILNQLLASDAELEIAAGAGRVGEGRSTAGDGTSNQGVNCTCCCN